MGKVLLAHRLRDLEAVRRWVGDRPLEARTPKTATSAESLHARLEETRKHGYAIDDQESDPGVNCLAFSVFLNSPREPSGAISVSALAHRTPLRELEAASDEIAGIIADHRSTIGETA